MSKKIMRKVDSTSSRPSKEERSKAALNATLVPLGCGAVDWNAAASVQPADLLNQLFSNNTTTTTTSSDVPKKKKATTTSSYVTRKKKARILRMKALVDERLGGQQVGHDTMCVLVAATLSLASRRLVRPKEVSDSIVWESFYKHPEVVLGAVNDFVTNFDPDTMFPQKSPSVPWEANMQALRSDLGKGKHGAKVVVPYVVLHDLIKKVARKAPKPRKTLPSIEDGISFDPNLPRFAEMCAALLCNDVLATSTGTLVGRGFYLPEKHMKLIDPHLAGTTKLTKEKCDSIAIKVDKDTRVYGWFYDGACSGKIVQDRLKNKSKGNVARNVGSSATDQEDPEEDTSSDNSSNTSCDTAVVTTTVTTAAAVATAETPEDFSSPGDGDGEGEDGCGSKRRLPDSSNEETKGPKRKRAKGLADCGRGEDFQDREDPDEDTSSGDIAVTTPAVTTTTAVIATPETPEDSLLSGNGHSEVEETTSSGTRRVPVHPLDRDVQLAQLRHLELFQCISDDEKVGAKKSWSLDLFGGWPKQVCHVSYRSIGGDVQWKITLWQKHRYVDRPLRPLPSHFQLDMCKVGTEKCGVVKGDDYDSLLNAMGVVLFHVWDTRRASYQVYDDSSKGRKAP